MSRPFQKAQTDPHSRLSLQTAPDRRQFLAVSFGWLLFWRHRRKLAGIEFHYIRHGAGSRRYLLIHGNEETARRVLTEHMRQATGTAWLVVNRTRVVLFQHGNLDPNRMFSREGAERNLRTLNPAWTPGQLAKALDYLDRHRRQLLDAVRPEDGNLLIATHNNQEYSVQDEVPISNRVALNDAAHPHEFCLATDPRDFDLLSKGPYNVVLQNHPQGDDDGSLSRYAALHNWRYVNLEVALGNYEKQREMLAWIDRSLPARY